jgi:hypothetical protein
MFCPDSKKIITVGLILSLINFASVAWMYPPTYKIIQRIIRQSARYIFALTRYDSVKMLISENLKWLFPKYAHQYEVLKLCFMHVRGCVPQYFNEYLAPNFNEHIQTRSRCYPDNPFKSAINYIASKEWNDFVLNHSDFDLNISYDRFKCFVRDLLLEKQCRDFKQTDADHTNCDFSCIESAILAN